MTLKEFLKERGLKANKVADEAGFTENGSLRRFYRIHSGDLVPDAVEAGMIVAAINRLIPNEITIDDFWPVPSEAR